MQGNSLQQLWQVSGANSGYSTTFLELENCWGGGDLIYGEWFTLAKNGWSSSTGTRSSPGAVATKHE